MKVVLVIVVVVLVVVALALWAAAHRKRRSEELRERFGPEYDRAVADSDRKEAERKLADIADRRDRLDIRPLDPAVRDRYLSEWQRVQGTFVDDPRGCVDRADALVGHVMRDRGYPVDHFDTKADMVAADHPHIVSSYRAAHGVHRRIGVEEVTTEELREAFVHYRALFAELLETGEDVRPGTGEPMSHHDVRHEPGQHVRREPAPEGAAAQARSEAAVRHAEHDPDAVERDAELRRPAADLPGDRDGHEPVVEPRHEPVVEPRDEARS